MVNNRLVFMNSGMHVWNRETEILAELAKEYEILLILCHNDDINYSLQDIINFCNQKKISLLIVNITLKRARNPINIFRAINTIYRIIKFEPDLIYIENFCDPYFAILCPLLQYKYSVIISILDYELHPYEKNKTRITDKFFKLIYITFFKNFQLFSSQQASLMKNDHPSKNIFYIPLFLIKNDFGHINSSYEKQNELTKFLFLGKIHFYKGLDILIKAGNILASRQMNFKIIIAGYCEDFTEYEQLIEYKNIYELKIGYLSKEVIKELMMDADVLILPYRQVTQSGPLMMAFHFGVIPLASDLYGFQELIINGQNGFLFKNNSVYDLVEVMQKILVMSGADRDIIKKNLKRFVSENYDPVKITNLYKSMFDSVIRTK